MTKRRARKSVVAAIQAAPPARRRIGDEEEPPPPVAAITCAADLIPDPANANLGTAFGQALLRESFETCGAGRPVFADRRGVMVGGNKTLQAAIALGLEVEVVQTTRDELVVVQRDDLTHRTRKARQLAYYDNRVSQVDLVWSTSQVAEDLLAGVNVGCAFLPDELSAFQAAEKLGTSALPLPPSTIDVPELPPASTLSEDEPAAAPGAPAPKHRAQLPGVHEGIAFDTRVQYEQWRRFLTRLHARYQTHATPGARVLAIIAEAP